MLGNISFLDIFDVYRVLLGMVSAELIFVEHAVRHREHFMRRVLTGGVGILLFALLCIPMYMFREIVGNSAIASLITGGWWLMIGVVSMCFIYY